MAAQKGSAFLVKIGDDGSPAEFTSIGGFRSNSIELNEETVDVTDKDDTDKYRRLLEGAGIKTASVSGSGVFKDSAGESTLKDTYANSTHRYYEITVPDFVRIEGLFQVTQLSYAGEYNGEATYNVTLESAGALDIIAV